MTATPMAGVVLFGRIRPLLPMSLLVESESIEMSGESYDVTYASLKGFVGPGWRLLCIARWPLSDRR